MDIRRLQYFLAVAEEGQITKAAQTLHMAQPPLSQQLKLLETELGVQLIDRCGSRKIRLTTAGQALRSRAEQIMELINQTEKEVKDVGDGFQGTLAIGIAMPWGITLGASFLLTKICSFHKCYPEINFQLWEGDICRIEDLLTRRVIEIGITRLPANLDIYETISLPSEPVAAAFTPKWHTDLSTNTIPLAALADKPLIVYRKYEERLLKYYQQLGLKPRILCTHDDIRSMLLWANAGLGVAFVQKSAANLVPNSNLLFKEIIEPTLMTRTLSVIWQKDRYLSAAARHFIELVKQDNN
ncbi:LysR family transcriptional regulator [Sporomusa acidovorans]|uniref:HTH-type transcriptional regulator CynR n=1 Tax=Sporomusa acidovorans (strain ATCC 49682 / DSM 3132 / Mol) TaxID=1123286 RepID=A0ABZ3J5B5_SPOA4|nr:LysR family transcriptional regulator [Sporomusa acidovorans]OZC18251.1 HTH-type transcriptional regulator CynR [Sporomusa acidovorans DSM 3132]SDF25913.1 DNA-binding transcriptional regulator, LysR family [Sporomusa acidovorans]